MGSGCVAAIAVPGRHVMHQIGTVASRLTVGPSQCLMGRWLDPVRYLRMSSRGVYRL